MSEAPLTAEHAKALRDRILSRLDDTAIKSMATIWFDPEQVDRINRTYAAIHRVLGPHASLWLQRPHPALNRQSPAQAIAAGNSAAVLRILEFLQQPEIKPTKPVRRGGTRKGTQL
jgi:hypothetical protein